MDSLQVPLTESNPLLGPDAPEDQKRDSYGIVNSEVTTSNEMKSALERKEVQESSNVEIVLSVSIRWEVLDQAPYSSDHAPSDLPLFRYLQHNLGRKRFSDSKEVKAAVGSWLSDQVAEFFEEGFQYLVLRGAIQICRELKRPSIGVVVRGGDASSGVFLVS
ncbi:hypothetical protein TNCV_590181 [Trichonephila clavipes]|nr:hypothetical protein TNCV_590181 [Trichonephila clavipes]